MREREEDEERRERGPFSLVLKFPAENFEFIIHFHYCCLFLPFLFSLLFLVNLPVKILIGEFIPFGANHIFAMNDKLGSTERVQGGLFTAVVDTDPSETQFSLEPGLTSVSVLEFSLSSYLNFEAEVNFPEDEGIKQIEQFGVHVNDDGMHKKIIITSSLSSACACLYFLSSLFFSSLPVLSPLSSPSLSPHLSSLSLTLSSQVLYATGYKWRRSWTETSIVCLSIILHVYSQIYIK